jgi:hypothetical protein
MVKVRWHPSLIKCPEGIWGNKVIAPHILYLCTRRELAVMFSPGHFNPEKKLTLTQWTGGQRSISKTWRRKNISYPCQESNPDFWDVLPLVCLLGNSVKRRKNISSELCFRLKYSCENLSKRSRVFVKYLMWRSSQESPVGAEASVAADAYLGYLPHPSRAEAADWRGSSSEAGR